jgi:hypothetical protein
MQLRLLAARCVRVVRRYTLEKRGRRESQVPAAPAASRAKVEKHTSLVTTGSDGFNRLSPRDGFNSLLRALPGDRALLPPSFCGSSSTKLSASVGAPGPHDFSVRLDAVRRQHLRVHRIPHPTFVTTRTPLLVGRNITRTSRCGAVVKRFSGNPNSEEASIAAACAFARRAMG